jgi:histidine ammonia-lyase
MKIFEDLREIVPKFQDDKIKYKDVQNIEHYLHENKLHFSLKL